MQNFMLRESPELLSIIILTILLGRCIHPRIPIVAFIVLVFMLYFYRIPRLSFRSGSGCLVSPAYGTISRILQLPNNRVLVSIFLSPFDIHAQYFPCDGIVIRQIYDDTGRFSIASDAYKSDDNEKMITILKTETDTVKITQLAGVLVRRISTPNHTGEFVCQGNYLGFIKFGSRVDIDFSLDSYRLSDNIRVGSVLSGPHSKIAYSISLPKLKIV
jgi:phosphatidylserine decarboxylase